MVMSQTWTVAERWKQALLRVRDPWRLAFHARGGLLFADCLGPTGASPSHVIVAFEIPEPIASSARAAWRGLRSPLPVADGYSTNLPLFRCGPSRLLR